MPRLIADRPLYCDALLSTLVASDDSRVAFQVASRAGKEIPQTFVVALRLVADNDGRIQQVTSDVGSVKQVQKTRDKQVVKTRDKASGLTITKAKRGS